MKELIKKLSNKIRYCRIMRIILIFFIGLSFIQFRNHTNDEFYIIDKSEFETSKIESIINSIESKDDIYNLERWQILDYDYRSFFDKVFVQAKLAEPVKNAKVFKSDNKDYKEGLLNIMQLALNYVNSLPTVDGQDEPSKVPDKGGSLRAKTIYLNECLVKSGFTGGYYPDLSVEIKGHKKEFSNSVGNNKLVVRFPDSYGSFTSIFSTAYYIIPGEEKTQKRGGNA